MTRSAEIRQAREQLETYSREQWRQCVRLMNMLHQELKRAGLTVVEDGEEVYYYQGEVNLSGGDNMEAKLPEFVRELVRACCRFQPWFFAAQGLLEISLPVVRVGAKPERKPDQVEDNEGGVLTVYTRSAVFPEDLYRAAAKRMACTEGQARAACPTSSGFDRARMQWRHVLVYGVAAAWWQEGRKAV